MDIHLLPKLKELVENVSGSDYYATYERRILPNRPRTIKQGPNYF